MTKRLVGFGVAVLTLAALVMFSTGGFTQDEGAPARNERKGAGSLAPPLTLPQANSAGMAGIKNTAEAGKYLFIFFHKNDNQQTQAMRRVLDATMEQVEDKAESVAINIGDPLEKEIVAKFRVQRSPMPLVLALAPNGAITRGFPIKFDQKQLMDAFASPCLETCLKALQERKLVLLCVQNGDTKLNAEAMRGVQQFKADPKYAKTT